MGLFNKDIKNDNKVSNKHKAVEEKRNNRLYLVDYENVSDAGLVGVNQLSANDLVIIFYGSKVKSIAYESLMGITASAANIEHMKAEKTAKNYLDFQLTTYLGYKLGQNSYSEIYVISKDSGFDAVVDFWNNKGQAIKRQEAIVVTKKSAKAQANNKAANKTSGTNNKTNSKSKKATAKSSAANKSNTKSTTSKSPAKQQPKKTKSSSQSTVTDAQKKEIRAAVKGIELKAQDYKKIYDAFASAENTLAYNNKLQKSFDNDKTHAIYKATSKIFSKLKK
ncbi:MAG: hypothetical protein K6E43_08505 [Lachnospiraceae bacterium]|nr:hypothetical protein [Lachnospiraceae bacterium]